MSAWISIEVLATARVEAYYENALEWVQDKGTEWLFSFTNICDLLGFDPDYLREVLLKRENQYVKHVSRQWVYSFPALSEQQG